jgi:hypothetical protein
MGEVEEEKPMAREFRIGEDLRDPPYNRLTPSYGDAPLDRFTEICNR